MKNRASDDTLATAIKNRVAAVNAALCGTIAGLCAPTACFLAVVYQQDTTGWQWFWLAFLMVVLATGLGALIAADYYLDQIANADVCLEDEGARRRKCSETSSTRCTDG